MSTHDNIPIKIKKAKVGRRGQVTARVEKTGRMREARLARYRGQRSTLRSARDHPADSHASNTRLPTCADRSRPAIFIQPLSPELSGADNSVVIMRDEDGSREGKKRRKKKIGTETFFGWWLFVENVRRKVSSFRFYTVDKFLFRRVAVCMARKMESIFSIFSRGNKSTEERGWGRRARLLWIIFADVERR